MVNIQVRLRTGQEEGSFPRKDGVPSNGFHSDQIKEKQGWCWKYREFHAQTPGLSS